MKLFQDTFATPFGAFSVAVNETGSVIATAFGEFAVLQTRMDRRPAARDAFAVREARAQIGAYFEGARRDFDLPLAPAGTVFQQRVWTALREIPFGETRSYGELAALLGNPAASRAVGRANAMNPVCVIMPCHRVIGRDGSLTGFAFGENLKRRLLDHEAQVSTASLAGIAYRR